MAYQARGRDPLFDSDMQAAIEKRGQELLGIALVLVGLAVTAMVYTYNPDDPSIFLASDGPVQNLFGRTGASISALLYVILGKGSWVIVLGLMVWGGRLILHRGVSRAWRAIFLPILIFATSIYASTLVPGDNWSPEYGLGGKFGDMVLGGMLHMMPMSMAVGIKVVSLLFAVICLGLATVVLGFSKEELKWIARFLLVGVIMTYATGLKLLGRGANGALSAA